jgi:hypothetical protein
VQSNSKRLSTAGERGADAVIDEIPTAIATFCCQLRVNMSDEKRISADAEISHQAATQCL